MKYQKRIPEILKEKLNLRHLPIEYQSLGLAREFIYGAFKTYMIILGENARFWICCPADAEKLARNGYEYAV